MQWSEVTKAPDRKTLRQFAGLSLAIFGSWAAWRWWQGNTGLATTSLGVFALGVGGVGLIRPEAIRWIFTGWMMAVFPIGWTISRVVLAGLFYLLFTPIAFVFRLMGRDVLHRQRTKAGTYWVTKAQPAQPGDYFRQF